MSTPEHRGALPVRQAPRTDLGENINVAVTSDEAHAVFYEPGVMDTEDAWICVATDDVVPLEGWSR